MLKQKIYRINFPGIPGNERQLQLLSIAHRAFAKNKLIIRLLYFGVGCPPLSQAKCQMALCVGFVASRFTSGQASLSYEAKKNNQ